MYNERNENFSIRDFLVQFLFIVLFVFILIWLFPTKGGLKDSLNKIDEVNTKFDVLTNRIFNDNLQTMKEAAIAYYTTPRLPKNVNDVKSMTLRKMLEEKLLIEFKDANNKSCDLDESYVEITKLEDEYLLKVNLSCTDNSAYILVHIGCYSYCDKGICEKKETTTPVVNQPSTPKPSNPKQEEPKKEDPKPTEPEKTCVYKYEKIETTSYWSDWSDWSETVQSPTKTKNVQVKTTTKKVLTGVNRTTYKKAITKDVQQKVGEVSTSYCTSYVKQQTVNGQTNYQWIDQGTSYYAVQPEPDGYTRYELEGVTPADCDICSNGILYIYRKYTLQVNTAVTGGKDVCTAWKTISAPVYITVPKIIGYETSTKDEPVYNTVQVKTYRYQTLITTSKTLEKTSSSKNDQELISDGYKYVSSKCE